MRWHLKDKYTEEISDDTEHYPIDQTQCMNIDDALPNVKEGEQIKSIVEAYWGKTNPVEHLVVYTGEEVATVNFTCRGTTLDYSCTDDALHEEETALNVLIELFDEILQ